MGPEAEYLINSKIYINEKKTSPVWVFVKVVLIIYAAIALFKVMMDGYFDWGILGNIALPLLLLGAAYLRTGTLGHREGYIPIMITIRFYRDRMQMIMGLHDFSDGSGKRIRINELLYSDIRGCEYSIPLICLRIAGKSQVTEYRNEYMAEKGESFRQFSSGNDVYIYLEGNRAEEILGKLKELSGCTLNYLN